MWEKLYQSAMCCEFSLLITTPCQSFMVPHLQMGSRPMARRMRAAAAVRARAARMDASVRRAQPGATPSS
jgi:hypothetical protein